MKQILLLLTVFTFISCGNKKVLQLPEISHSEITDLKDVSHAYLFYDESQKDGVELNRKNLIGTTNWLINVDKRLLLKQAIPHIKYLQEKKSNSSHKNKDAKNYFTCSDTSKKNLGFIEFTDVVYHKELTSLYERKGIPPSDSQLEGIIRVITLDSINIFFSTNKTENIGTKLNSNHKNMVNDLNEISTRHDMLFYFAFNEHLSFQDYISVKSTIQKQNNNKTIISHNEFISN
jgi:hypothetical protein